MTISLVITRDAKLQQNEKMVKNVSGMVGWIITFLLKKISCKNLFSLARTIGFSTEAPFWARKFSIFRNHENWGAKTAKIEVFRDCWENYGRYGFSRIFPITLRTIGNFFSKKSFSTTLVNLEIQLLGGCHPVAVHF